MSAQLLGAHMPAAGGIDKAIRRGAAIGCTAVQVFTTSPQSWKAKEVTDAMVQAFRMACEETRIEHVVSHDSYLVNLCAPDPEMRAKSREGLIGELRRCGTYGIRWVVSHLGAHMGQGEEEGLRIVAEEVREVLAETPESVTLLAETTAGQGSALDYRFEHFTRLFELTGAPERLAVCLDTAHIFAAGYDIRTAETYAATFDEWDRRVGIERIQAIHCNDSKKALGTRVDRHAPIGEGEIGAAAFECLVNDLRFERIPILLETPDAETMHAVNLQRLRDLRHNS